MTTAKRFVVHECATCPFRASAMLDGRALHIYCQLYAEVRKADQPLQLYLARRASALVLDWSHDACPLKQTPYLFEHAQKAEALPRATRLKALAADAREEGAVDRWCCSGCGLRLVLGSRECPACGPFVGNLGLVPIAPPGPKGQIGQ